MMTIPKEKRVAVYAGSFDPPTRGHEYVAALATQLFDELVIVVAHNPEKKCLLTPQDRTLLWKRLNPGCGQTPLQVVELAPRKLVADVAKATGAHWLVRGLRSGLDLEYETAVAQVNQDFGDQDMWSLRTVFFRAPAYLDHVSSTLIRGLVGVPEWEARVHPYVSPEVVETLKRPWHL